MKKPFDGEKFEKFIAGGIAIIALVLAVSAIYKAHSITSADESNDEHAQLARMFQSGFHPVANPNPNMRPSDVLSVLLSHFRTPDYPVANHGYATAWRFASPQNRELVGSEDNLRELIQSTAYRDLVEFRNAYVGQPSSSDENRVRFPVLIQTPSRGLALFVFDFELQQDGEYRDHWMTSGVSRIDLPEDSATSNSERVFDDYAPELLALAE